MTNNRVKTKKKKTNNKKTNMKIKLNKIVINPNIQYIPINNIIDENEDFINKKQQQIILNTDRIRLGMDENGIKYTPDQIKAFKGNITRFHNMIEAIKKKD